MLCVWFDIKADVSHQNSSDHPLHLTPREEMETNLIRSLIASYFGITRQTIQDLVPKAIMHLPVSIPSSDTPNMTSDSFTETHYRSTSLVMRFNNA